MSKRVVGIVAYLFILIFILFTLKLACIASSIQEVCIPVNVKLNPDKYQILKEEVLKGNLKDTISIKRVYFRGKKVRAEKELQEFLRACSAVSGFGMSQGPCPLKMDEVKTCLDICDDPLDSEDRKKCCAQWDEHKGCCAECSFPSAISWVLGNDNNPTDNGQKKLFQAVKEGSTESP